MLLFPEIVQEGVVPIVIALLQVLEQPDFDVTVKE
jgi:hypothetical protein